jgi:hypothetical protein
MRPSGQNFISTRILLIPSASSLPTTLRAAQSHSAYLHPLRFLFPLSIDHDSLHPSHQSRARPQLSSSPSATRPQPDLLPPRAHSTRVYGLGLSLYCFRASDCLSHEHRSISVQLVLSHHFSIQLNNEVTQRISLTRIVPHPFQPCRARVLGSCLTFGGPTNRIELLTSRPPLAATCVAARRPRHSICSTQHCRSSATDT